MGTGEDFLQRVRASRRSVWYRGKQVVQLEQHPAFGGTIRSIAEILDLQDDPQQGPILTYVADNGKRVHRSFAIPLSREEVEERGRAMALWSEASFGMMSRIGVTYRAQVAGFYGGREAFRKEQPEYVRRLEAAYQRMRDGHALVTSAGHDPQINRGAASVRDIGAGESALRIVRRTEDGVVLQGAMTLATGSPYNDEIIVSPLAPRAQQDRDYSFLLLVAADTPGLHHICRDSFASTDRRNHPLSARFDEMDAVLVFDEVLVPWERVLLHEDPEALAKVRRAVEPASLGLHESVVRLHVRLRFVLALAYELVDCVGSGIYAHVRQKLAELIVQSEGIGALIRAAEQGATPSRQGVWLARAAELVSAKNLGNRYYPRAIAILQQLAGAGLLQTPADIADLSQVLGGRLAQYYQGSDRDAVARTRLMKLAWDLIGSAFASRGELYERFYAGDPARTYGMQYATADLSQYRNMPWP